MKLILNLQCRPFKLMLRPLFSSQNKAQVMRFEDKKEVRRRGEVVESCTCGIPGVYDVSYYVSRRGYDPGEKITVDIRGRNFTGSTVTLTLRFKMSTSYNAQGKTIRVDKRLHEGRKEIGPGGGLLHWRPELAVPPLPPSGLGGSRVIDLRFWLEMDVVSASRFTDSLHFTDEIRIGTLPLGLAKIESALPITQQPSAREKPYFPLVTRCRKS